jgi:hypothetical protein
MDRLTVLDNVADWNFAAAQRAEEEGRNKDYARHMHTFDRLFKIAREIRREQRGNHPTT